MSRATPLRHVEPQTPPQLAALAPASVVDEVRFAVGPKVGTASWSAAMRTVGDRLRASQVAAVVFVHGTFTGSDPLSAMTTIERVLPRSRPFTRSLRRTTRATVERLLGDLGNFGTSYARTFEEAIGGGVATTTFTWSSENHHVGRLEAALDLIRVLATHAEIARDTRARPTLLVMGHSHAGQVCALVTQLLAGTASGDAVRDVARARGLDLVALEADLATLSRVRVDFATFGSPARYAWAEPEGVRILHVLHAAGDVIRRLGSAATDLPAMTPDDRLHNASLDAALGRGRLSALAALRSFGGAEPRPNRGDVRLVDYGGPRFAGALASHGLYTRHEAMLFNAQLVAGHFYPVEASTAVGASLR